jgi:hypothetical protein
VQCPAAPNRLYVQDHGADFARGLLAQEPPVVDTTKAYAVLVPLVDPAGNDIAGIRTPHVSVPLATFTGWNLRSEGHGPKAMASIIGSYFPLALTAAQRHSTGDPRPALAERYRSQFDYIAQIARAAQALVEARLLLAEDADRYVEWAVAEKIWQ